MEFGSKIISHKFGKSLQRIKKYRNFLILTASKGFRVLQCCLQEAFGLQCFQISHFRKYLNMRNQRCVILLHDNKSFKQEKMSHGGKEGLCC